MKAAEVVEELKPLEDSRDGFGRTRRVLLRRPRAEFSASAFSARLGDYVVPNRDYSYEGLTFISEGEPWKLLDGLAFSLCSRDGAALRLEPRGVTLWPWKATYSYSAKGADGSSLTLNAENYLFREGCPLLCTQFFLEGGKAEGAFLRLKPLADIRHIFDQSDWSGHSVKAAQNGLVIERAGKGFALFSPTARTVTAEPKPQRWNYKLGSGERWNDGSGPRFRQEERTVCDAGVVEIAFPPKGPAQMGILEGGRKPVACVHKADERAEIVRTDRLLAAFHAQLSKAQETWGASHARALAGRMVVLAEKLRLEHPAMGETFDAGAYWFRSPWLGDSTEALWQNYDFFLHWDPRRMKREVAASIATQSNGWMPKRLPAKSGRRGNTAGALTERSRPGRWRCASLNGRGTAR